MLWIEPASTTAYVAVERGAYTEVHPVAGGLPVRVATSGVAIEGSSASVTFSEHDRDGRLVRREVLEASVAG
jgi:hypothetical protein